MGSNTSSLNNAPATARLIPREPIQEFFDIPEVEDGYPPPRLPTTPKKDVYHPEENRDIYFHALKAPKDIEDSWEDLVHYLTAIYRTDMMKVRSIFSWLGIQDIERESFTFVFPSSNLDDITPREYKKLIKQRRGSYASLFALLCRKSGIPCAIINGLSKASGYEVGMKDVSSLRDRWNAVYVSGWRLVHPVWAFQAVISYKRGLWVPSNKDLEIKDVSDDKNRGIKHDFNEYFFLVDPSELVTVCLPDDPKWQLHTPLMTQEKWVSIPHLMKRYHMEGFKIPSEFTTSLIAKNGICSLKIKAPDNKTKEYQLAYDFFFNLMSQKPEVDEPIVLSRYVLMSRDCKEGKWLFEVRLPVAGLYRLTVYGGPSTKTSLPWICDVAVMCDEPAHDVKPYPACPSIGFGPVSMTKNSGLVAPSHSSGVIFVKPRQEFHITFKPEKHIIAKASLVTSDKRNLDHCVVCKNNNTSDLNLLVVTVDIPSEGEYALLISTRPRDAKKVKWSNVCNYYISTDSPRQTGSTIKDKPYRTAFENNTRKDLEDASKGNDLSMLFKAVKKFKDIGLHEVDGSLEKASAKLEYLELAKALKEAINRLNLDLLNSAIKNGEESSHAIKLTGLLDRAREERQKLLSLNKFLHDVLEMRQSTITEMLSYHKPIAAINAILKSMLILLGEPENHVETWEGVKSCMRKTGKLSVLRRIRTFENKDISVSTIGRVQKIIAPYNEDNLRSASAGAATFYLWVKSIVDGQNQSEA